MQNLQDVHGKSITFRIVDKYNVSSSDLLKCINQKTPISENDAVLITDDGFDTDSDKKPKSVQRQSKLSEVFAGIASLFTILVFVISFPQGNKLLEKISILVGENDTIIKFLLGIGVSILASVLTAVISYIAKKNKNNKQPKNKKSSNHQIMHRKG